MDIFNIFCWMFQTIRGPTLITKLSQNLFLLPTYMQHYVPIKTNHTKLIEIGYFFTTSWSPKIEYVPSFWLLELFSVSYLFCNINYISIMNFYLNSLLSLISLIITRKYEHAEQILCSRARALQLLGHRHCSVIL